MEVEELMIGDWVLSCSGKPVKISLESFVADAQKNKPNVIGFRFDECKPIPLTAEILKANGFVYDEILHKTHNGKEYYSRDYVELEDCLDDHFYPIPNTYRINVLGREIRLFYVHQLQHALRLRGLKKLANNFEVE